MQVKKATRRYSPVRVVNPTGDNHLVCLKPNQNFLLVISQWVGLMDMDFASPFFSLEKEELLRDGTKLFYFAQNFDLSQWAKVSSCYLGEVVVVGKDTAASLCVTLSCEKTDVFTVINPQGTDLKIKPHQVLEVVLYDKKHPGKWQCKIISGDEGIQYIPKHYTMVSTNENINTLANQIKSSKYFAFPRSFDDFEGFEHHYWFEFDAPSIQKISQWKTDTYKGGRLIFESMPIANTEADTRFLHVNLGVRGRNKRKLNNAKRLPDSLPTDEEDNSHILSQDDIYNDFVVGHNPRDDFDDYNGDDFHIVGGHRHRQGRQNRNHTQKWTQPQTQYSNVDYKEYKGRPMIQEVTIKERVIADTMDALFIDTHSIDQSAVNMTTTNTRWHNKNNWQNQNHVGY